MVQKREESLRSLTLATVVAGIGVNVLASLRSVGSGFLSLLLLQLGPVFLAAIMGSSILVGQSSVTDIAVVEVRVDGLATRVRVRGEDICHSAEAGIGVDNKQKTE